MELTFIITVGLLFALLGLLCVFLVIIGLPGAWMIMALAVIVNLVDSSYLAEGRGETFSWWILGICLLLAILGEILEFAAGALGAKKEGRSPRGMWGALIGGLVGAILGIAIPIPVIGSLIGAVIGTFVGAILGELSGKEPSTVKGSLKPATGATIGRILGTLSKLPLAFVIWLVLVIDAFWV